MSTLESGPKLNWTRDNQMYECYRIWKKKVEFIFCSALADATPKQLVSYLKYWMGGPRNSTDRKYGNLQES